MGRKIIRSIILVMALFASGQGLLFTGASAISGIWPPSWGFFLASAAVHLLVTFFLIRLRYAFIVEPGGRKLESVNLANIITLVRISTLPTILFLILGTGLSADGRGLGIILALSGAVFLSDLLDGLVARKLHQGTLMGRMLDSVSDYLVLGFLSIAMASFDLIAPWFFWIILFRLLFQALGMTLFFLLRKPLEPRPTLPGKAAVASTMILYGLAIIKAFASWRFDGVFLAFEIVAASILVFSVFDKALVFLRHARAGGGTGEKGSS